MGRDFLRTLGLAAPLATGILVLIIFGALGSHGVLADWWVIVGSALGVAAFLSAVLSGLSPSKVGASDRGFAIVRPGRSRSGQPRLEAIQWDALLPGARSIWVPLVGRRYPVRILHAASTRSESVLLNQEQAETLALFPAGSELRKILN